MNNLCLHAAKERKGEGQQQAKVCGCRNSTAAPSKLPIKPQASGQKAATNIICTAILEGQWASDPNFFNSLTLIWAPVLQMKCRKLLFSSFTLLFSNWKGVFTDSKINYILKLAGHSEKITVVLGIHRQFVLKKRSQGVLMHSYSEIRSWISCVHHKN